MLKSDVKPYRIPWIVISVMIVCLFVVLRAVPSPLTVSSDWPVAQMIPVHRSNGRYKHGRTASGYSYLLPSFLVVALITLLLWHYLSRGEVEQGYVLPGDEEHDTGAWPPQVLRAKKVSASHSQQDEGSDKEEQLYLFALIADKGVRGCFSYKSENSPVGPSA